MVAEYLRGGVTLRELERTHGVSFSTIHRWVQEYERREGQNEGAGGQEVWRALVDKDARLSADVRQLRRELEEARLHNKLLNAMIDIAEEQFEIPIRKKSGAKR